MLFRMWYHTCQLAILAMFGGMIGIAAHISLLVNAVWWVTIPIGCVGAVLGVVALTAGIRSACPTCGRKASWIYSRRFLGIDCDHCGVYGGYPLMHIVPLKVEIFDPMQDAPVVHSDPFDPWKK